MGVKISISPAFVLLWTSVYFFDTGNMLIPVAISVTVHELSHLLALHICGSRADALYFRLMGMEIITGDLLSYPEELLCAAAGPLANAALAALAAMLNDCILAGINLSLFLFNILPVRYLDGGKMLFSLIACFWNDTRADRVVYLTSLGVMLILTALAVWLKNWIFVYFALMTCKIWGNGVKFQAKRT